MFDVMKFNKKVHVHTRPSPYNIVDVQLVPLREFIFYKRGKRRKTV